MKFHWLILVLCLTAQAFATTTEVYSSSSGTLPDVSTPPTDDGSDNGSTPSTVSGRTENSVSSSEPNTSVPGEGGSSTTTTKNPNQPETSPTVPTKTTTTTTQPQGSTLPNVDVPHVQFKIDSCANGDCTYTYLAPQNDQTVLQQDQDIITVDRNEYNQAKANVATFNATIGNATDPAIQKVKDLQDKLEIAREQLVAMQQQLKYIVANTQSATKSLDKATYFINNFLENECFNRCATPPTLPPTTTPTTPAPTTTEDICVTFCKDTSENNCTHAANGPFCEGCDGNLDGYSACKKSACATTVFNPFQAGVGIFKSPDYNDTVELGKDECYWHYPAAPEGFYYYLSNKNQSVTKFTVPASVTINLIPDDPDYGPIKIADQASVSKTNIGIKGKCTEGFTFDLQLGPDVAEDFSFEWNFSIEPNSS